MPDQNSHVEPRSSQIRPALILDGDFLRDNTSMIRRYLIALVSEGFVPIVVGPPGGDLTNVISPSVEIVEYPVFQIPLLWIQNRTFLLDMLDDLEPTILHCLCPKRIRLTAYVAEALDLPYVASFSRPPGRWFHPRIQSTQCRQIIGTSPAVVRRLNQVYPRMANSVRQVCPGEFVGETCACYADPNRQPSLIAIQPLEDIRYFEFLLNAIRHLAIDGLNFAAAILGQGRGSGAIHRMIRRLGLSRIVTVAPPIKPLQAVLSAADLFIQSGRPLDMNPALLDAMSVGMAAALSKNSLEEILAPGVVAEYFDPGDEFSMYSCLQKLLTQREHARHLGRNAQEYMRRHHSVSQMMEELIRIYQHAQQGYSDGSRAAQEQPAR